MPPTRLLLLRRRYDVRSLLLAPVRDEDGKVVGLIELVNKDANVMHGMPRVPELPRRNSEYGFSKDDEKYHWAITGRSNDDTSWGGLASLVALRLWARPSSCTEGCCVSMRSDSLSALTMTTSLAAKAWRCGGWRQRSLYTLLSRGSL